MNCFEVDREQKIALRPRADLCVQCGACIVQCKLDALHFENHQGKILPPQVIRSTKLNMMGKRAILLKEKSDGKKI
jgi:ferredoxin